MGITADDLIRRRQVIAERLQQNHNYSPVVLERLVTFQLLLEEDDLQQDPLNSRRERLLGLGQQTAKMPAKSAYRLAKGASMDTVCKKTANRLPEIAIRQDKEKLKRTNTDDPASIDWRDPDHYHYTRLHKAVEQDNQAAVVTLVEQGANVNIKGNDHWTPLGLAVQLGLNDIVAYLRDK